MSPRSAAPAPGRCRNRPRRTEQRRDLPARLAAAAPPVHAAAKRERSVAMAPASENRLPHDGLVAIVKRDCPTCVMTAPVLGEVAERAGLTVYTQDDPGFPETVASREADFDLAVSHRLGIEIVPTLIRFEGGRESARSFGWDRAEWERLTGISGLGRDLPDSQPGCGARNVEP